MANAPPPPQDGIGDDFFEQIFSMPPPYAGGDGGGGGGGLAGGGEGGMPTGMVLSREGGSGAGGTSGFPLGLSLERGSGSGKRLREETEAKADRDPVQLAGLFPPGYGHLQSHQIRPNPPAPTPPQTFHGQVKQGGAAAGPQPPAPRPKVRARRGQATDPHSIAERLRRERIAERMRALQELVPNTNKTDRAAMLDEILDYVKFLRLQVKAFEPPFDMSQDIDIDEHGSLKSVSEDHLHTKVSSSSQERDICAGQLVSATGSIVSGLESSNFCRGNDVTHSSQKCSNEKKEIDTENLCNSVADKSFTSEHHTESCSSGDDIKVNGDPSSCCLDSTDNGNVTSPCDLVDPSVELNVPLVDVDKVRCIIRNIVRDWAAEGQEERDQCYKPILAELNRLFPDRSKERPPSCLVPGAGLGRLALEISCLGFISQGNEFSYYMMICSNFILNHAQVTNEWTIYPWIHSNCNSQSDNDQLRPVSFPDIHPASAGITEGFSMCGGDFVEVYNDESQEAFWDAVVTCFFLDTAHNIVEYIEIISKLLKSGGVWINLGPLLYHFADSYSPDDEMSIELSLEDVKKVAFHYGFEMEIEKTIETTYTANPRSMMQNRYLAAFWTMKKKPVT